MKPDLIPYIQLEEIIAVKNTYKITDEDFEKLCNETNTVFERLKLDSALTELQEKIEAINVPDVRKKLQKGAFIFFLISFGATVLFGSYKLLVSYIPVLAQRIEIQIAVVFITFVCITICFYHYVWIHIITLWKRWKMEILLRYKTAERRNYRNLDLLGIIENKYSRRKL
jgi:hypothetical protein